VEKNGAALKSWISHLAQRTHVHGSYFAKVHIENNTSKKITGVLLDTRKVDKFDAVIAKNEGEKADQLVRDTGLLAIPDLGPGDTRDAYIWSVLPLFDEYNIPKIKLHSSEGGYRLRVTDNATQVYEPGIWGWLDQYYWACIAALMGALSALLMLVLTSFNKYMKDLLGDDTLYASEKARYDQDPKKFTPRPKG